MPLAKLNGPPHAAPIEAVLRAAATDAAIGLTSDEAARRLAEGGPNELPRERPPSAAAIVLRQLRDPLILILLVAIALSAALGHALETAAIGIIAAFAVTLGFAQEFRAQRTMEALRRLAAPQAHVLRDGAARTVEARDLVPGDLVLLAQGDIVPADVRLVEAADLQAAEASLTGESVPVEKDAAQALATETPLGDRATMAYAATAITHGRGRGVVVSTGSDTEVGRIGQLLASVKTAKTPLERQLARLARWLVLAGGSVVLLIVVLGLLRDEPVADMVLFGIALAVAAVPEALPAVVTISLAIGAQRMAKRNALVRRLPVVETLGATTVICSDKTGTLTTGRMVVAEILVAGQSLRVSGTGYDPEGAFTPEPDPAVRQALESLLAAACLCNDADLRRDEAGAWAIEGDPTEAALVVAAAKLGLAKRDLESAQPRRREVPFTSERKRMTTVHAAARDDATRDGGFVAYSKGAVEVVLPSCTRLQAAGAVVPLDDALRRGLEDQARDLAGRAMRVLAVAMKAGLQTHGGASTSGKGAPPGGMAEVETGAEAGMVFLGLVGMRDPPRAEARDAIAVCHAAGIRPVMITGDHPATASAVAAELGIRPSDAAVTGAQLAVMPEEELRRQAGATAVYARVSPADKLRIVAALQAGGHVVAMTGDGVNDAPALRKADIGVAMGITGTDVSKEAAGMMLADDNFATIVAAVEEGRAIFDNVRKYLMYLLSTNFGEILLIAAIMFLGWPLPLTAVMILYVNLASDGLPALALAVDPHEPDLMRRPPRRPSRGVLERPVVVLMLLGGIWSAIANLAVFGWALSSGRTLPEAMTMTFVSLILIQFAKAYVFRSDRHPVWERTWTNRWLNLAIAWEVALLLAILYVPFLRQLFGVYPLPAFDWLVVLVAAASVLPVLEAAKWVERRWLARHPEPAGLPRGAA